MIKCGLGYDIHRLKRGRRFLLAGVEIPARKGELGHSDGDVLAHAVMDALLGASALGDIGGLFPPSDAAFKGADSMALLREVCARVKKAGWRLVNLDCVVICETPKILPYRGAIRASLAAALETSEDCVFVKGKTKEGLGEVGKGKAVETIAQCLICNEQ